MNHRVNAIVMTSADGRQQKPDAWYFALLNMAGIVVTTIGCLRILYDTYAPIPAGHHFAVGAFAIETLCVLTLPMIVVATISYAIERYRKRRGITSDAHDEHNAVPFLMLKVFVIILLPCCLVFWGMFMMVHH